MSIDKMSREAMLLKVKAAEKEAMEREAGARKKSEEILAHARKKAASIVDSSESEGRTYLREQLETVRAEGETVRQERLQMAREEGLELKRKVEARMPAVTRWVYERFCSDYDVED